MNAQKLISGLPYLATKNPRGKIYYYVQIASGEPYIPIEGSPGSPQFMASYQTGVIQGLKQRAYTEVKTFNKHKIGWLIEQYEDSAAFNELSKWTKRNKRQSTKVICSVFGQMRYCDLQKQHVTGQMEAMKHTPSMANRFMYDFRALINWAIDQGFVKENILQFIKALAYKQQPHKAWTDWEMTRFAMEFDYNTQERLAFELLSNLGARTGDIIRIGAHNVTGNRLHYKSEKTGIDVTIIMSEDLQKAIAARQFSGLTFVVQPNKKKPFPDYKQFSNWFQQRARRLGIRKPIHGIRKTVACRQLEGGANVPQAMATQGWISPATVLAYARDMDREKIGLAASHFLHRASNKDDN